MTTIIEHLTLTWPFVHIKLLNKILYLLYICIVGIPLKFFRFPDKFFYAQFKSTQLSCQVCKLHIVQEQMPWPGGSVALECHPTYLKVVGSSPSQSIYLGSRFNTGQACKEGNQLIFLSSKSISIS